MNKGSYLIEVVIEIKCCDMSPQLMLWQPIACERSPYICTLNIPDELMTVDGESHRMVSVIVKPACAEQEVALYISDSCPTPDTSKFCWKAESNRPGTMVVCNILLSEVLNYNQSWNLHFAVLDKSSQSYPHHFCTLVTELYNPEDDLNASTRSKLSILRHCYRDINGSLVSIQSLARMDGGGSRSLIYGEVDFLSLVEIVRLLGGLNGGVFYDLGCGTGKPVLGAFVLGEFRKCVGIEIVEELYKSCLVAADRLKESKVGDDRVLEFIHGDILELGELWCSEADVVFVSGVCFETDLFRSICSMCERVLREGSVVVSLRDWEGEGMEVLRRGRVLMSWGSCEVVVLQKK